LIVVWIISAYRGRARRKESRQIITELNQRTAELAQHRAELETERRKLRDEKAKVENTTTALVALSQHVLGLCDDKVHDANSLDWSGAVAASERADRCAREALSHHVTKAVYYDPNYPGSWMKASIAEQTRDFFVNRWFVEKDAQQLKHWINQLLQDGEHAFPGRGRLTPEQEHVRQLERENKILRQERDILKKAVAIFSHPRK
jgi:transposase